jgi:protein-S-isoprenylcysteine O-methyltransferase Ste14
LCSLLYDTGFSPWHQPQFWLIPPAVSVLIAAQLNRQRLAAAQLAAVRYASILVIYLSSTSEMFLRGIGESLWPPMVLAALSVCGVLLGIALRIRAFLYLGSSFVLLSVVSMIWHASRAIQHVWPWWAFGIGMGLVILTLFGLFEKKRPELTRWIETLQQWDQ